ncbi:phosphoglycerate kinase [Candidatus Collierbacteria bacterium]|nr:phosphoglycerate kinase [Candidatus Collierbacteria bacterium]
MSRKPEGAGWLRMIREVDVMHKNVLVRLDLDVPLEKPKIKNQKSKITDESRLINSLQTIQYLVDRQAKITIIGHLGRPHGKRVERLSLQPVTDWFEIKFPGAGIKVEENLRFDPREEANSPTFAQNIVRRLSPDVYVFDAFGSYRPHASVISVPKLVPTVAIGFRFAAEISHLSKVLENPKKPVIFIIGGVKADTKISLIPKLAERADEVLAGGLLVRRVQESIKKYKKAQEGYDSKLQIAELRPDGLDITEESARMFADKILSAGTVVWNGPMGKFEDGKHSVGTEIIARAVNETKAYTVVGGGDTETALTELGLENGIDWISSGGGAMLYYLAHGTLPFLEAIKN